MEEKILLLNNDEDQKGDESQEIQEPEEKVNFLSHLSPQQLYLAAGVLVLVVIVAVVLLILNFSSTSTQQPPNPYQVAGGNMQAPAGNAMDISVNGNHANPDPNVNVPTEEDKAIVIAVQDDGRTNPFKPMNETSGKLSKSAIRSQTSFDIIEPPSTFTEHPEIRDLMNTKISGILYEQKNPSAIINISGHDYFVKQGDFINNYHILNISRDEVVVESQNNIFKAKVGQILNSTGINQNTVYNLRGKFGGSR